MRNFTSYLEKAAKFLLYLLPVLSLIIAGGFFGKLFLPGAGDLFFPFITGKNFFFRIIVEILLALWVFLWAFDKKYAPRPTLLFWAVLATLGILILSTFLGENPYRSFWSNYERMEGLISHLHLFAYFLVLTSVFREEKDWKRFFAVLVGVSIIISFYGYLQLLGKIRIYQSGTRLDATLGNSTYLAIFIIFHLFFLIYAFLRSQKLWAKILSGAVFLFELPIVFFTATRGAILGLVGGLVLFSLLLAIFGKSKRFRIIAFSSLGAILVVFAVFWAIKDTNFAKENYILSRFSNLSFQEQTVTSRLTIWSMAWEGSKENPILGWGLENFNLVFNKYFRPELWSQEPWFDRAHNVFFDWLISSGILGLLTYLSIFAASLYLLWRNYSDILLPITVTSLFAVYFFHNLFVFDNLTSYFLFFSVLGFINFRSRQNPPEIGSRGSLDPRKLALAVFVFLGVLVSLYWANLKPLLASKFLLSALQDMAARGQDTDLILADFEKALKLETFGNQEVREQLAGYTNQVVASNLPPEEKQKVITKAVFEMEKQVRESPDDARGWLFLAILQSRQGRLDESRNSLEKALALSPKKQQIIFLLADIYISLNQKDKALELVRQAYEADSSYGEAVKNFIIVSVINGQVEFAEELSQKHFGEKIFPEKRLLNAYAAVSRYDRVRDIWLKLLEEEPSNPQYHVSLAASYLKLGQRQNAILEIRKAMELDPRFKPEGERLISEIQAGRNP